jgi:U3 small nucleolar RNA-associated protein 10
MSPKSIVTSYSNLILTPTVDILTTLPTTSNDADHTTLWNRIISTLHASFTYDQDSFWQSPAHFSAIAPPLLSSLSHYPSSQNLISCITALAVAADSADHHKTINASLLTYMRADDPIVRLAAVKCEISLTEKLGEDWLALLPEMLPSISEGQEDDDERVEREVGKWIRLIEGILGESLESMLV